MGPHEHEHVCESNILISFHHKKETRDTTEDEGTKVKSRNVRG